MCIQKLTGSQTHDHQFRPWWPHPGVSRLFVRSFIRSFVSQALLVVIHWDRINKLGWWDLFNGQAAGPYWNQVEQGGLIYCCFSPTGPCHFTAGILTMQLISTWSSLFFPCDSGSLVEYLDHHQSLIVMGLPPPPHFVKTRIWAPKSNPF